MYGLAPVTRHCDEQMPWFSPVTFSPVTSVLPVVKKVLTTEDTGVHRAKHEVSLAAWAASLVLNFQFTKNNALIMLFSKEYVGYLAREVSKKLVASGLIETKAMPALTEQVHAALLEELALEDRINDEVRVILEAYSDEMQKSGANYQEMFRKVKTELAKKYKAIL